MRAADLAEALAIPANQASFHLRQLAKYGLVEPAPEAGRDRRDRYWKPAAPAGLDIDIGEVVRNSGEAVADVFRRDQAAWGHRVVDAVYSASGRDSGIFRSVSEQALRLTKDEARQVAAEVSALLDEWQRRTREADGERRTYLHFAALQPYPGAEPEPDSRH